MGRIGEIAVLAGLSVLHACGPAAPQMGPEAVDAIQVASDSLEATYLRGDANALANLVTENVVVSPIGFADLEGRESVRSLFTGAFQTMKVSRYRFNVSEAEIFGDVAYDRGRFEWESSTEDGSVLRTHGRYSGVRHRGPDGVWRLHRLIENEIPSGQP